MGSVEEFNKRRDARMRAKDGREDDQWITMKGTHVLIDDDGQVSGGPDRIREAVKGKGGYKTKGTTEEKKAPKGKKQYNGHDIGMLRKEYKKMLDEHGGSITNKEYKEFQDKYGLDTVQAQNIKNYWYVGAGAKKIEKEKAERGAKVDYSYGPGEEKNEKPQAVDDTSYERFPTGFKMGGREHTPPDDVKKIRETVSRFMKNAKEGDVYTTGGGVGSAGGTKFKVVRSRGKLGLAWERDGYYLHPVQMSRQNVEKFISNGAKLVSGTASKTPKREYSYGSSDDRGKSYENIARSLKQYNKHEYPAEWKKAAEQWNDAYDKASAEEKKIMHKILKDYGL